MAEDRRTLDVAVCTFRRPALITALVPLLLEQADSLPEVDVRVSVVDNDPEGSAFAALEAAGLTDRAHVVVEPTAGLAAARNRALVEAAERDLLVFIDDDEEPREGWLRALVEQQAASGAAAVSGPVVSELAAGTDPVTAASPLFARPRRATGARRESAATNNLLLDLRRVRAAGLAFDPRFSFTGGEDTFFTRGLVAAGGEIVWCDEAVVSEVVPPERSTPQWVRARARRNGETWAWVRILGTQGRERTALRARLAARGAALVALHTVRERLASDAVAKADHRHRAAGGLGIVRAATTGRVTEEYAR